MKKSLSNEAIRSLLQHIMFGVLFVLIILNWSVHRPVDYEVYNEALKNSETLLNARNKMLYSEMQKIIEQDEYDEYKYKNCRQASKINTYTKTLLEILDSSIAVLHEDKNSSFIPQYRLLGNSAIASAREFYNEIIGMMEWESNLETVSYLPLNKTSINQYEALFGGRYFALDYLTKDMMIGILNSIKNDAINTQMMMLDRFFDHVNEAPFCNFGQGDRPIYILNDYFFSINEKLKIDIVVGGFWSFGKRYSKVKVDQGAIYDSILNTEMIAYWQGRANALGKNIVTGSISKVFKGDTIIEAFSFSYFVSAPGVAFHLDKANVCYVGVPNRVSINIPGYSADKIKLRVAGAKVSKAGEGQFDIFISKMPAGKVYAYVDAMNAQGRTSTVHSMELKLQHLPAPLTNFEAYKENGIALADFKAQKSIQLFPADTAFAIDYSVVSFEVECINARHQYTEGIEVKGADFETNVELQKLIASAQPGDRFIFSRIIAKAANGLSYDVLPVSVVIQ